MFVYAKLVCIDLPVLSKTASSNLGLDLYLQDLNFPLRELPTFIEFSVIYGLL